LDDARLYKAKNGKWKKLKGLVGKVVFETMDFKKFHDQNHENLDFLICL